MHTNYQQTMKFSLGLLKMLKMQQKKKKIVQLNIMYPEGDIEVCLKVFLILLAHYLYHFNRVNPMLKHQNGWTGQ